MQVERAIARQAIREIFIVDAHSAPVFILNVLTLQTRERAVRSLASVLMGSVQDYREMLSRVRVPVVINHVIISRASQLMDGLVTVIIPKVLISLGRIVIILRVRAVTSRVRVATVSKAREATSRVRVVTVSKVREATSRVRVVIASKVRVDINHGKAKDMPVVDMHSVVAMTPMLSIA